MAQYAIVWYTLGKRDPADRAMAYLEKIQNKSGGFNGETNVFAAPTAGCPSGATELCNPYRPEKVDSYELGMKTRLADGKLIDFARALVGRRTGGLALVTIVLWLIDRSSSSEGPVARAGLRFWLWANRLWWYEPRAPSGP